MKMSDGSEDVGSDKAFVTAMIEHHRQAIAMSKAYLAATDPATRQARVAEWAREIVSGQADEIKRVSAWLPTLRG